MKRYRSKSYLFKGMERKDEMTDTKVIEEPQDVNKVMRFDYTPALIMQQLSKETLAAFQKFWDDYEDGMDCSTFVQLVLDNYDWLLGKNDDLRYELVYGCLKLFAEVDINGDGGMEWAEFMQYIIDAVSGNTISGTYKSKQKKIEGKYNLQQRQKRLQGQTSVKEQLGDLNASKFYRFNFV